MGWGQAKRAGGRGSAVKEERRLPREVQEAAGWAALPMSGGVRGVLWEQQNSSSSRTQQQQQQNGSTATTTTTTTSGSSNGTQQQ